MASGEVLKLFGVLKGHTVWVTQVVTTPENPNLLVSASRGIYFYIKKLVKPIKKIKNLKSC